MAGSGSWQLPFPGWVYLVGGGPGDPGLLTTRARRLLEGAEVIVFDPGLEGCLRSAAAPTAQRVTVAGEGGVDEADPAGPASGAGTVIAPGLVAPRLARWVREGLRVVRLYRGDPATSAVAREEARRLVAAGVPFVVVPGVASGAGSIPGVALEPPLSGLRVLVTRAAEQAGELAEAIRLLGAEPVEAPLIAIRPAAETGELDECLRDGGHGWWAFTSANAVRAVAHRLEALGLDARALAGARLAVVGEATRAELARLGLRADLVPREFTGEHLWSALAAEIVPGDRVVWPRGDRADTAPAERLRGRGADLRAPVAYRTVLQPQEARVAREELLAGRLDVLTFASPSAVEAFVEGVGRDVTARCLDPRQPPRPAGQRPRVVCIGPRSAERARRLGLPVDRVPAQYTAAGLVSALVEQGTAQGGD
ncbi:MAG TPA: uroporphyrinogen-III synthase [Thermaerobacter sp.]